MVAGLYENSVDRSVTDITCFFVFFISACEGKNVGDKVSFFSPFGGMQSIGNVKYRGNVPVSLGKGGGEGREFYAARLTDLGLPPLSRRHSLHVTSLAFPVNDSPCYALCIAVFFDELE